MYSVWPRDSAADARRALLAALPESLSRGQWWARLSPLVARFGDGHTNVAPPLEDVLRAEAAGTIMFPPSVALDIDGHLEIATPLGVASGGSLERGDRIVAINGLDADSLLNAWMREQSGEADAFRAANVTRLFRELLIIHDVRAPFTLTVSRADGERRITVPGLVRDSLLALIRRGNAQRQNAQPRNFTYRVLRPGVGHMNFLAMDGDVPSFRARVTSMFEQVARDSLHTLVIDLRSNGGGDSRLGDELLRHFTTKSYRMSARKDWKMSAEYRRFFKSLVKPPLGALHVEQAIPVGRAMFNGPDGKIVTMAVDEEAPRRAEPFFSGTVCVITGPSTFSSAADFADAIKTYHLATIVGEETGGRPNGFGEVYWFRLPRSGMLMSVSSARFVRASGDTSDRRGVMPDIEVRTTSADRRAGRDAVLERAANCPTPAASSRY